jgi:UDP:flavonoid glycosyltransferase YjiC (YdhE family)
MNKRFLFVMVEGGGNVAPQLGIARRLAARGHRVRILSDPAIAAEVAAAGLEFVSFRHAPHQNMRNRAVDTVRDWAEHGAHAQLRRITSRVMFGPAALYARDLLEALEQFPADAVAVDYMVVGALIGAERARLPTGLLVHTPYPLPTAGVPPFGLGLMPARSAAGRLRDRILGAGLTHMFNSLGLAPLNAARTALGLSALTSVYDQLRAADKILVMTADLVLSERVFAVRSAPHRQVFAQASCVVAHGGHGTVMKALAAGVPLLCVPLGRDQADNAARVVASGSGLRLKASASVTALRSALARLISEPSFTRAAATLASAIATDVARDAAVAEFELLASLGALRPASQAASAEPST